MIEICNDYLQEMNEKLSNLVKENFKISLTDHTIFRILKKHKITRKRLRNKYYPEKKLGQKKRRY